MSVSRYDLLKPGWRFWWRVWINQPFARGRGLLRPCPVPETIGVLFRGY